MTFVAWDSSRYDAETAVLGEVSFFGKATAVCTLVLHGKDIPRYLVLLVLSSYAHVHVNWAYTSKLSAV